MSVSASSEASPRDVKPMYVAAWLLCALFYLYQYAALSAPGVMQGLLSTAWGGNHIGSMISGYYVAYALIKIEREARPPVLATHRRRSAGFR